MIPIDFDLDLDTDSFIRALNTCCPLCGDILEWTVVPIWTDRGYMLTAEAESCGVTYRIKDLACGDPESLLLLEIEKDGITQTN